MLRGTVQGPEHVLTNFKVMVIFVFILGQMVPADFVPRRSRKFFAIRLIVPRKTALRHAHGVASQTVTFVRDLPTITCIRGIANDDTHIKASRDHSALAIVLGP